MTTWILTWNPDTSWQWDEQERSEYIRRTALGEKVEGTWSVGHTRHLIVEGDRCFLFRQGTLRGIVASGVFASGSYRDSHWDGTPGKMANYADVSFDLAVGDDDLLPVDVVLREVTTVNWNSVLASGIRVPPPGDRRLEALWAEKSRRH